MTPKEKANELMNKFFNYCSYEWYEGEEGHKENMKQCALIAVDLVLGTFFLSVQDGVEHYWKEVKQEIEAL